MVHVQHVYLNSFPNPNGCSMKYMIVSCFLLCFVTTFTFAQLPQTVVYLFDVHRSGKQLTLDHPKIISNKKGYNNQPYFSPDGKYLFYVSSVDTSNTEIMRYDLQRKKSKRLTRTKEPEYSPRYSPDLSTLTCVRVEKDQTTQHLACYTFKGKKPLVILPQLTSIGYYEWINQNEFMSFELPEPFYLVRHNISNGKADTIATHIGRTISNVRTKSRIAYIDKSDSMHWNIRTIAPENLRSKKPTKPFENPILTETLPGEEDFCVLQDGSILMGHEGKIYIKKNPFRNKEEEWTLWADLQTFGIQKFYRMAISVDNMQLAVVVYQGEKP